MGGASARDLLHSSRRVAIATPSWIYLLDTHEDEGIELGEEPHLGPRTAAWSWLDSTPRGWQP